MPSRIEDYAVIGNCETVALVGLDGAIDWLGLPRFDSAACFAALLGGPENGRWLMAPFAAQARASRRYRGDTLILETQFDTPAGCVRVIDFMASRPGTSDLIRVVQGVRGSVAMQTELVVRFDYGTVVPWSSRQEDGRLRLVAGPDCLLLDTEVALRGEGFKTVGEFTVEAGQEITFSLSWQPSFRADAVRVQVAPTLERVEAWWNNWAAVVQPAGEWSAATVRSLLTLKALSHWETGGIVAAGTTSLPEQLGGTRNWDYRYCWLRDATSTLYALMESGFLAEAVAWRDWLLRAVAGDPGQLQIMYGVAGERRLDEYEVPWLSGYEGAAPVRIGNAAATQIQLDVYGEVLDALYVARRAGMADGASSWPLERALVEHLETIWELPDRGMWEVRGPPRHFTHSKVMAWVAFDRAVRSAAEFGLEAPIDRWREVRDRIHREVCREAFDVTRNTFVQAYGYGALDASLLLMPLVGFLPPDDPRVLGTLEAVERLLLRDGFVMRYDTATTDDGLPPGEGCFIACSFWLVDSYVLQGRDADARRLFLTLLALCNDLGLLAEQYDPRARRQVGNFPQAFSHLALVNSARNLTALEGPAHKRASCANTLPR